jgi:adenine/guanine phosphoribosyltransferase-like PRPP-binding protein
LGGRDPFPLRALIRDIPDFPRAGIVFKDITPLLLDREALDEAVTGLAAFARPLAVDLVSGLGGQIVGCCFLIELSFLDGRDRLAPYPVHALIEYSS